MLESWLDAGAEVAFPGRAFISQAEFYADAERDAARRARQARIEAALATPEPALEQSASCAVCLRPATLRSSTLDGHPIEAGLRLPNWPQEQLCDCEDRLCGRDRALVHAALALAGLRSWSRLLLFGPAIPVHRRLAAVAGTVQSVPDLARGQLLAAADASADLVLAIDCLHRAPALRPLMDELRRVAGPGACLLARVPFRERAAVTAHRRPPLAGSRLSATELHAIGWDIVPMLRDAGFEHAEVIHFWSRELGYFGASNFLLRAVA